MSDNFSGLSNENGGLVQSSKKVPSGSPGQTTLFFLLGH